MRLRKCCYPLSRIISVDIMFNSSLPHETTRPQPCLLPGSREGRRWMARPSPTNSWCLWAAFARPKEKMPQPGPGKEGRVLQRQVSVHGSEWGKSAKASPALPMLLTRLWPAGRRPRPTINRLSHAIAWQLHGVAQPKGTELFLMRRGREEEVTPPAPVMKPYLRHLGKKPKRILWSEGCIAGPLLPLTYASGTETSSFQITKNATLTPGYRACHTPFTSPKSAASVCGWGLESSKSDVNCMKCQHRNELSSGFQVGTIMLKLAFMSINTVTIWFPNFTGTHSSQGLQTIYLLYPDLNMHYSSDNLPLFSWQCCYLSSTIGIESGWERLYLVTLQK